MRIMTEEEKCRRLFAKNVKRYYENGEWLFSWREMLRVRQLLKLRVVNGEVGEAVSFNFTYGELIFSADRDFSRIECIMGAALLGVEEVDALKAFCEEQYA